MSEFIYTQKRTRQYNGPVDSADHNARIEENYKDLVYLYNKYNVVDQKLSESFQRVLKDHIFINQYIKDMEDRIKALESAENLISIHSYSQIDNIATPDEEDAMQGDEVLSYDPVYNLVTLPKLTSSSHSKLKFFTGVNGQIIPDFFETRISNSLPGVDVQGAILDSNNVYNSILDRSDKYWKRSIISAVTSPYGAQMYLYIKVPSEYTGSKKSNFIKLNPYPLFGVDILSIEYTTISNPTMTENDVWYPLNRDRLYDGNTDAVGKVPPGSWTTIGSDYILNSGPIAFQFPELEITAIRIAMRQKNYLIENNKYVYTYGLSDLDIRYDKFLPTGRMIFKFDAPEGDIISSITSVTPKIYNVSPSLLSQAFSYRVIYNDGSIYTLENPGSSNSVWIEVTLNQLPDGTAPVLSDLVINYN
jgi:hypothetical protein